MAQREIELGTQEMAFAIIGNLDSNINFLEKEFLVNIIGRGTTITVIGEQENIDLTYRAITAMQKMYTINGQLDDQAVRYASNLTKANEDSDIGELSGTYIVLTAKGKPVRPKTLGQKKYVEAIKKNFVVFGVGPAGTGKTYLAVAMAVQAFKNHEVTRIILTRPAVEAGEKLGFLPGDLQNKVDPYLRPLYDALFDLLGAEGFQKHLEKGIIEVAPLAYMRGRTLDNAFIILDEAQNTTPEQMKMFLTRLGTGSKMVVNGDITQIDLVDKDRSGLIEATRLLKNIEGITDVRFNDKDIVRFRLVADIVKAYARASARKDSKARGTKY
ncbi:MAG: PhoH family protein [Oscillospiraceae bacterium]|nr:PhoH family protein [Oscillospiraceae bacterium]